MKVRDIVDTLATKGIPLTKEQREALENEGHRRSRELRQDMRELVSAQFKVDKESIERAAKEAIGQRVDAALADSRVDKLVTEQILKNMPVAKSIETILKEQILIAAGLLAKDLVAKNVHITFNEAGKYNEGGSF